jgi:hypothetical protein
MYDALKYVWTPLNMYRQPYMSMNYVCVCGCVDECMYVCMHVCMRSPQGRSAGELSTYTLLEVYV